MEIYNEKLRDLLNIDQRAGSTFNTPSEATLKLRIREHPTNGIYVQNLSQYNVTDLKSTLKYLAKGNQNRVTASTHIHDKSSRSHAIFTITFIQVGGKKNITFLRIYSLINICSVQGQGRRWNADRD